MIELHDSLHFQFLQEQILLLLTKPKACQITKHFPVLAVELFCVYPAVYRQVLNSGVIRLPDENLIRRLLACAPDDNNL